MKNNTGTFDNLVAGLSIDDRISMLQQMKSQIKPEIKFLEKDTRKDTIDIKTIESLKNESFFLRLILTIKALFSHQTKISLYSDFQLERLTKTTALNYPDYFNAQDSCLERGFYDILEELKGIRDFFKPSIIQSEEKPGDFLILLGSLILTDLEKKIEEEANPYNSPFPTDIPTSLRVSLYRKIEGILAGVSALDKEHLYTCVKSLYWLRDFCDLPFEAFQQKFANQAKGKMRCFIRTCPSEMEQLTSLLCNSRNIEPEILEALYLFSIQTKVDNGENIDVQTEIENHMITSLSYLKNLIFIINTTPFRALYKITKRSLNAEPEYSKNTEDWFVLYKEQWKKRFDTKWANWQHDRNLEITKRRISALCEIQHYPLIPYRPWEKFDISFKKDYTIGFLHCFFNKCYSKYKEVLKVLLMNGEFIIPENKSELMDTYSEFNSLAQKIKTFNEKLSNEGVYGGAFLKFQQENLYTIHGKSHMNNLLLTLASEIDVFVLSFSDLLKSFQTILDGILVANFDAHYDGIANLATLTLPNKAPIRNRLIEIKDGFTETEIILKDLASIELRGTKTDAK